MSNKTKILFLTPYPHNTAPSQRFRFEQFYQFLTPNKFEYETASFLNKNTWKILYAEGKTLEKTIGICFGFVNRFFLLFKIKKFGFIFIHREASPVGPPIFEWVIAKILRKKIIYDFDDAIWLPNTSQQNSIAKYIKWHYKVASICKWSYRITCGNYFLMDYSKQFNMNVVYFPTVVDTEKIFIPKKEIKNKITIGWTGSHSTMKYLDSILPVIKRLEKKYNIEFLIISNKKPQFQLKSFRFIKWNEQTEIADLNKIDIGLMPLEDTIWEQGKCGFKAIQYMSLEIPAIVSPVGVNRDIIKERVNGMFFNDNDELFCILDELIIDRKLRKKLGEMGRSEITNNYSVNSQKKTFLNLFNLIP